MNRVQPWHRGNQSHPTAGLSHRLLGTMNDDGSSSTNVRQNGHDNDNGPHRYDTAPTANSQSRTPSAPRPSFVSSHRWEPPERKQRFHERDGAGSLRTDGKSSNRDRNKHYSGAGSGGLGQSRGGGKVTRRRRHSSHDARNERNKYHPHHPRSRSPPRPENDAIATPEQPAATSQPPAPPPGSDVGAAVTALPRLDPADPAHARRIQQRRRQVLFGKNTAGYEEYTKKVPRHKRRPRSMECPMTPDHMADIPAKRWQGMMNAW